MDEAIRRYPPDRKRSAAMPLLHLWQEEFGFISDEAVRWIAAKVGQPNALVIFVGGDPTDEDAFSALPDGITVGVSPVCETAAKYCLDGPDGVRRFLEWLRDQVGEVTAR